MREFLKPSILLRAVEKYLRSDKPALPRLGHHHSILVAKSANSSFFCFLLITRTKILLISRRVKIQRKLFFSSVFCNHVFVRLHQ